MDGGPFPEENLPFARVMQSGEAVYGVEHAIEHPDGRRVMLSINAAPLRDVQGNLAGMVAVFTDITDRKQTEEALRNSEAFLNSIIEQNPYALWISDEKGTLIRLNQACRDLLHITDKEVVGKYNVLADNIVAEQGHVPLVKRVFEQSETVRFDITYDSSQLKHLELEQKAFVNIEVTISPVKNRNGKSYECHYHA